METAEQKAQRLMTIAKIEKHLRSGQRDETLSDEANEHARKENIKLLNQLRRYVPLETGSSNDV